MDPDFWHTRWQDNLIGFHQNDINSHLLRFWPQLGLATGSRILVPLCGKSLDMLWLRDQDHAVTGVEVSQLAVETFFEDNGLTPEIHEERFGRRYVCKQLELLCADFFSLTPADIGAVGAVYDRAALIALTATQRPGYAEQLIRLCTRDSMGLLITLEYNQLEMSGPPFAVDREEVYRLFDGSFTIEHLFQFDALQDNQKFREKGLTQLSEHVYRMSPHAGTAEKR
jgi:thiopurine S-methyltransferase